MGQTTQNLTPYVKVNDFIEFTPNMSSSRKLCLLGFVQDPSKLTAEAPLATPIEVGTVTTTPSAVQLCKALGLQYKFASSTTLDMDNTDEIAAMIIMYAITYESHAPDTLLQVIEPASIVLGILNPSKHSRDTDPYGDFFKHCEQKKTVIDVIAQPYEYKSGDIEASGNYYSELKHFSTVRWESGEPIYGMGFSVLTNTSWRAKDIQPPDPSNYQLCSIYVYPQNASAQVWQLNNAMLAAVLSTYFVGITEPYGGFWGQIVPTIPLPWSEDEIFRDDTIVTLNKAGFAILNANPRTYVVSLSRMLVSLLQDPVTEVGRSYMLDYQSWKANYAFKNALYKRLLTGNIINQKFTVNAEGESPVLSEVQDITFAEAVRFAENGIFAIDPNVVSEMFKTEINPQNTSEILNECPFFPAPIIYQINTDVIVKNVSTVLNRIAISTGEE